MSAEDENSPDEIPSDEIQSTDNVLEEIGYKNPPRSNRFQPGRSGNPAGRPKGALNFATILKRSLEAKVIVNENGVRKKVTKFEAAMMQVANKAATGDYNSIRHATELLLRFDKSASGSLIKREPNPDVFEIQNADMCRRAARVLRKLFELAPDEVDPILVLTKKQEEEFVLKMRKIYGLPLTPEEAIKLANTGFAILEAENEAKLKAKPKPKPKSKPEP
jgi:hypothetical protein